MIEHGNNEIRRVLFCARHCVTPHTKTHESHRTTAHTLIIVMPCDRRAVAHDAHISGKHANTPSLITAAPLCNRRASFVVSRLDISWDSLANLPFPKPVRPHARRRKDGQAVSHMHAVDLPQEIRGQRLRVLKELEIFL